MGGRSSKAGVRFGFEVFERFFEHSIELCRESGLLSEGPVYVDITLMRAAASMDSLVERGDGLSPPYSAVEYIERVYHENEPHLMRTGIPGRLQRSPRTASPRPGYPHVTGRVGMAGIGARPTVNW